MLWKGEPTRIFTITYQKTIFLHPFQSGFIQGDSTTFQLLHTYHFFRSVKLALILLQQKTVKLAAIFLQQKTVKLAATVKNGKVGSNFSAAKTVKLAAILPQQKMVKLAAILWQRKTVKLAQNFCWQRKTVKLAENFC